MKHIWVLFFFSILLFSCEKEAVLNVVPQKFQKLEKVASMHGLKQMLNNASGSIGIKNMKSFGLESGGPSEVYASFFDANGRETFGALKIQDVSISPSEYDYYFSDPADRYTIQGYFGDIQPVKLYAAEGSSEEYVLNESIYLPQELYVQEPIQRGIDRISQTTTITWNPDPQNVNGVFILIDFLPGDAQNEGRFVTDFASHRKFIYTEDDGAYQLQTTDFNKVPSGAHVTFIVGRGDYVETIGSNDKSYIIYSFTGAIGMFVVDEVEDK